MRHFHFVTSCLFFAACGSSAPSPAMTESTSPPQTEFNLAADGLLGAIDQKEVQSVFDRHMQQLLDCYSVGLEDLEELEGDLEISVRIDLSGRASTVFLSRSSIGSVAVEECVVRRVSSFSFPQPQGGPAELTYPLELTSDTRAPKELSLSSLEDVKAEHEEEIERCQPFESDIVVTLYVDAAGRVLSVGGSGKSASGYEAAQCLARVASTWTFPAPRASIAKGSLTF
ncbi:MAG: AgmX/PglI C-terminal domain-containing protein [Myxococcota bacterium]|jgi:hypothetical protein|nr:AgmX/PglI C-terminal domain-containing protein [Myxococcota bacterium]